MRSSMPVFGAVSVQHSVVSNQPKQKPFTAKDAKNRVSEASRQSEVLSNDSPGDSLCRVPHPFRVLQKGWI
jgi:hypothetical protein